MNCVQNRTRPARPATVAQLRNQLAQTNGAVDPESLWALSTSLPFAVHVTWSRSPDAVDAWFVPDTDDTAAIGHDGLPLPAGQTATQRQRVARLHQ